MVPFSLPIISFTPMLKNLQTNKTYQRQIIKEAKCLSLTFIYIDDALSIIQTIPTGLH
jgi:hypothetical protein